MLQNVVPPDGRRWQNCGRRKKRHLRACPALCHVQRRAKSVQRTIKNLLCLRTHFLQMARTFRRVNRKSVGGKSRRSSSSLPFQLLHIRPHSKYQQHRNDGPAAGGDRDGGRRPPFFIKRTLCGITKGATRIDFLVIVHDFFRRQRRFTQTLVDVIVNEHHPLNQQQLRLEWRFYRKFDQQLFIMLSAERTRQDVLHTLIKDAMRFFLFDRRVLGIVH